MARIRGKANYLPRGQIPTTVIEIWSESLRKSGFMLLSAAVKFELNNPIIAKGPPRYGVSVKVLDDCALLEIIRITN